MTVKIAGKPNIYPHGQTLGSRGKVYVASSWRNEMQQAVVHVLRAAGFSVYDFKNPEPSTGFAWHEVGLTDPCSFDEYVNGMNNQRALEGFNSDYDAMLAADIIGLVLPGGKSAPLELGWAT